VNAILRSRWRTSTARNTDECSGRFKLSFQCGIFLIQRSMSHHLGDDPAEPSRRTAADNNCLIRCFSCCGPVARRRSGR
jgi:hypothetical protein